MQNTVYKKFGLVMLINTLLMFLIPYVMIDRLDHMYFSLNRLYMTLMMVAPMGIVMLLVMGSMFEIKRLNYSLIAAFSGLFVLCFMLIRTQTPVGNAQAMQSMIPNNSSSILICRQANVTDPEARKLCDQIVKSQEEQIGQMKAMLARSQ